MAQAPTGQPDFDFWDFVNCSICHLPFGPENGGPPQVPFWLTDCGHIICNSHLNADQSCAHCGARAVEVVPLQHEMDPVLSDMFRSIPHAMDSVANAAKFQLSTIASLASHYRSKCMQQRSLIERMKAELQKKKARERNLEEELARWHQSRSYGQDEPMAGMNVNGKRPMGQILGPVTSAHASSSPQSMLGPNRLTLPPDEHHQPRFPVRSASRSSEQPRQRFPRNTLGGSGQAFSDPVPVHDRPGSSRFATQYAYNPPPTLENHVVAPGLSHEQQAPARMALVKRQMELLPQAHPQQHAPTVVPKFKPAGDVRHVPMHQDQRQPQRQPQANPDRMRMPPPPAPAPPPQMRVHGQQRQGAATFAQRDVAESGAASIAPRQQYTIPATPGGGPQRFMLDSADGAMDRGGLARRTPSRVVAQTSVHRRTSGDPASTAQRRPFMPGQGGFG